jgi:hypothetical protein
MVPSGTKRVAYLQPQVSSFKPDWETGIVDALDIMCNGVSPIVLLFRWQAIAHLRLVHPELTMTMKIHSNGASQNSFRPADFVKLDWLNLTTSHSVQRP